MQDPLNTKTSNGNSYVEIMSKNETGSGIINEDGTIKEKWLQNRSSFK